MPAELLADESVDSRIVRFLRHEGVPVSSVREECPGASDSTVLELSTASNRVLLTEDSDFGEWVFAHRVETIGVIFLRYRSDSVNRMAKLIGEFVLRSGNSLRGKFVTITPKKLRMRDI